MSEKLKRFTDLLKNIFELDKSDLDFGIYRIINIRKEQIENFLTKTLPEKVKSILNKVADNVEEIREQMDEIKKQAASFNAEAEQNERYRSLKEQYLIAADIDALETDVYTYLFNFFKRYYDEGDFISKRRYKEGVYAIPYEGEEVKLYWANQDQYYIKTTENFTDYSFLSDGVTIHFMLVNATTEQNNNKENGKKRAFMLFTENKDQPGIKTFEVKENEFIIRFTYDISEENQKTWKEKNLTSIKEFIIHGNDKLIPLITPSVKSDNKAPIEKHLESYIAKNTFDYFIHKDLSGFLNRELDFFIKNEIIHLDDIDTSNEEIIGKYIAKTRAVKRVGKIIIDFLAQIENFQKKLWLKKKFIIRTDWCITLDRVPEELYEEICKNEAQIQEWIDLYSIDEADNWTKAPSVNFLKANKNLIIDTKHFTPFFKEKLISTIDTLDEAVDGILIHSSNFQALKLLNKKYKAQINCIYIDPPYNSGENDIPYKNGYKNSSWLSLLQNTLSHVVALCSDDIVIFIAIDDYEVIEMCSMLKSFLSDYSLDISIIEHHPQGGKATVLSTTHDYMIIIMKNQRPLIGRVSSDDITVEERPFRRSGTAESNFRHSRQNSFYAILVDNNNEIVGIEKPPIGSYPLENTLEGYKRIYPIGKNNTERVWRKSYESCVGLFKNKKLKCKNGGTIYQLLESNEKRTAFFSVLKDSRYNTSTFGANLLKDIMGSFKFSYPKSFYTIEDALYSIENDTALILDYFAGSATTGHAVVNLNRVDDGNRKYILVEMGNYFNTVTKPRMQKIIYSKDWKDGKPATRDTGVSHLIKYFQLESYEDTLTNIEFSDNPKGKSLIFGDDYLINYMLDTETKGSLLNINKFNNPFDYCLKITEKNEIKETPIDLPETFNYLMGLTVIRQGVKCYYKSEKNNKEYEGSVDLMPDNNGDYCFKQIVGKLSNGNKVLIIWRNITDNQIESNAALDAYFQKNRIGFDNRDFDLIFVNGDNNLENLRSDKETWKVKLIEKEFLEIMFEE